MLVDSPGNARSVHEAPEIDGIIAVPTQLAVGDFHEVVITGSFGTDLLAMPRMTTTHRYGPTRAAHPGERAHASGGSRSRRSSSR